MWWDSRLRSQLIVEGGLLPGGTRSVARLALLAGIVAGRGAPLGGGRAGRLLRRPGR